MVPHLAKLFRWIATSDEGCMTEAMRTAAMSMLYKGKGKPPQEAESYRPLAIKPAEYRIMTKAIQLKLRVVVELVVGKTHVAYMGDGRQMRDSTILLAEAARRMHASGGAVILQVDNSAAFDRVRWDFMQEVLEAMGMPAEFRSLMRVVYADLKVRVRMNGKEGRDIPVTNGVPQGCGISPLIFLRVQEVLLMAIRVDPELKGVEIMPGVEAKERGMADDTVVYLRDARQSTRLFRIISEFEVASGRMLNPSKTSALLVGDARDSLGDLGVLGAENCIVYGEGEADKG